LEYKKLSINQSDLHALQWASEYSKECKGSIDAFILIKEELDEKTKQKLNEFSLKRCFQIPRSESEQADVRYIETLISHDMYDLIISGDETEDDHNRSLVPLLAYSLGISVLTSIHKIKTQDTERLTAHRKEERGATQVFNVHFPAALSLTPQISKLRYRRNKDEKGIEFGVKERQLLYLFSERKRFGAPEPAIIFGNIPNEESAEARLLNIMGFSETTDSGVSQQTQVLSEEYLHFTAERLMKWLKE